MDYNEKLKNNIVKNNLICIFIFLMTKKVILFPRKSGKNCLLKKQGTH